MRIGNFERKAPRCNEGASKEGTLVRARLMPVNDGPMIELVKDMTVVGRNDDCDVRLESKSVSSIHCVLVKTDGLIVVRDLGSTNGTRVNGQRVRRAVLLPNDHVAIATFRYRIKLGEDSAAVAPEAVKPDEPADPLLESGEHAVGGEPNKDAPPLKRNALPDVYPDRKGE